MGSMSHHWTEDPPSARARRWPVSLIMKRLPPPKPTRAKLREPRAPARPSPSSLGVLYGAGPPSPHRQPKVESLSTTFESKTQIRFPDCDPFRHLNNARYLDYFMNAREDHLKHYMGFDIYALLKEQAIGWVVSTSHIAYLSPAQLMETVVIDSTLLRLGAPEALVEMRMWDEQKSRLKALLWSTFVLVDVRTGKPIAHPEELAARFAPVESPLADPATTFEQRIAALRSRSSPPER